MSAYTDEDIEKIFTEFEIRPTAHRLALLKYISHSKLPMPASRIVEMMKKKYAMDQATVYRALAILCDAQALLKIDVNGVSHYEMNFGENAIILACTKCGALDKIYKVPIDDIIKKANKQSRKFATVNHINMRLYGLCKSCYK